MAKTFQLTAQLVLQGVDAGPAKAKLQRVFDSVKLPPGITKQLTTVAAKLKAIELNASKATASVSSLAAAFTQINSTGMVASARSINSVSKGVAQVSAKAKDVKTSMKQAKDEVAEFGRVSGLAVRRFAGFTIGTFIVFGLVRAIGAAFSEAVKFDRELVKISQVTGRSLGGLKGLSNEISRLSTTLGVASGDLIGVSRILAQTGLSASETKVALDALAKSTLAPTFGDINKTAEGSIAIMRQFHISVYDLGKALGSVNAVAGQFAVESEDILSAVRRTGGVFFAASDGIRKFNGEAVSGLEKFQQFIALFTSVRATTRETAETIATGMRTIFTRIQRPENVKKLRDVFGIELEDSTGNFVGAFEAIKRLNAGLGGLNNTLLATSEKFRIISEMVGGFRQMGKTIPLIRGMALAMEAYEVAQRGEMSLEEDAVKAQQALAVQLSKVREEFVKFVRDISDSGTLRSLIGLVLDLTRGLIQLASSFKGVLPLLGPILLLKGVGLGARAASKFPLGLKGVASPQGKARGGLIHQGSGPKADDVLIAASRGEYIIPAESVTPKTLPILKAIQEGKQIIYAAGGWSPSFRDPGPLPPYDKRKLSLKDLPSSEYIKNNSLKASLDLAEKNRYDRLYKKKRTYGIRTEAIGRSYVPSAEYANISNLREKQQMRGVYTSPLRGGIQNPSLGAIRLQESVVGPMPLQNYKGIEKESSTALSVQSEYNKQLRARTAQLYKEARVSDQSITKKQAYTQATQLATKEMTGAIGGGGPGWIKGGYGRLKGGIQGGLKRFGMGLPQGAGIGALMIGSQLQEQGGMAGVLGGGLTGGAAAGLLGFGPAGMAVGATFGAANQYYAQKSQQAQLDANKKLEDATIRLTEAFETLDLSTEKGKKEFDKIFAEGAGLPLEMARAASLPTGLMENLAQSQVGETNSKYNLSDFEKIREKRIANKRGLWLSRFVDPYITTENYRTTKKAETRGTIGDIKSVYDERTRELKEAVKRGFVTGKPFQLSKEQKKSLAISLGSPGKAEDILKAKGRDQEVLVWRVLRPWLDVNKKLADAQRDLTESTIETNQALLKMQSSFEIVSAISKEVQNANQRALQRMGNIVSRSRGEVGSYIGGPNVFASPDAYTSSRIRQETNMLGKNIYGNKQFSSRFVEIKNTLLATQDLIDVLGQFGKNITQEDISKLNVSLPEEVQSAWDAVLKQSFEEGITKVAPQTLIKVMKEYRNEASSAFADLTDTFQDNGRTFVESLKTLSDLSKQYGNAHADLVAVQAEHANSLKTFYGGQTGIGGARSVLQAKLGGLTGLGGNVGLPELMKQRGVLNTRVSGLNLSEDESKWNNEQRQSFESLQLALGFNQQAIEELSKDTSVLAAIQEKANQIEQKRQSARGAVSGILGMTPVQRQEALRDIVKIQQFRAGGLARGGAGQLQAVQLQRAISGSGGQLFLQGLQARGGEEAVKAFMDQVYGAFSEAFPGSVLAQLGGLTQRGALDKAGLGAEFLKVQNTQLDALKELQTILKGTINVIIKDIDVTKKAGVAGLEKTGAGMQQKAGGGTIFGKGGNDRVGAMLTAGEFVVNKKQTQRFLPLLQMINEGRVSTFQKGGVVDDKKWNEWLKQRAPVWKQQDLTRQQKSFNQQLNEAQGYDVNLFRETRVPNMRGIPDPFNRGTRRKPNLLTEGKKQRRIQYINKMIGRGAPASRFDKFAGQIGYKPSEGGEAVGNITNAFDKGAQKIEAAAAKLGKIPNVITVEGNHTVDVRINGAEMFNQLIPTISKLVLNSVQIEMDKRFGPNGEPKDNAPRN